MIDKHKFSDKDIDRCCIDMSTSKQVAIYLYCYELNFITFDKNDVIEMAKYFDLTEADLK